MVSSDRPSCGAHGSYKEMSTSSATHSPLYHLRLISSEMAQAQLPALRRWSVVVLGHSFVRRLRMSHHVQMFTLSEAKVNFVFRSGATIEDVKGVNATTEHILHNTDVLYLEIGSNDLTRLDIPVGTLVVNLKQCIELYTNMGIKVVCGEVLQRSAKSNSTPTPRQRRYLRAYNKRVHEFNHAVAEFASGAYNVLFWFHRALSKRLPFTDGVHPSGRGLQVYARSVRGAVLHAIVKWQ